MPKISVIMSVYSEDVMQLTSSIESVLQQDFIDFEYIIVLDNPENVAARKYINSMQGIDSRIIFLENKKNIKLGASLNKGIQIANGKYIARMDGDDVCDKSKLRKQYKYLEENNKVDLLFTGWKEIDEEGNLNIRIPTKIDFINIKKTFFYKSPLLHASMMCKRSIFKKYSYPEIDRPEDFSLFLLLISEGYCFDILEEDLYTYFVEGVNIEKKYIKIRIFSSNFLNILSKNVPRYYNNIHFWCMLCLVIIQWILSRNFFIYTMFFQRLQNLYKYLFQ